MIRQQTILDGEWEFFPDPQQVLTIDALRSENARTIRVPGPWQAQFEDLRDYSGVAWYRKVFDQAVRRSGGQAVAPATAGIQSNGEPTARPTTYILHFGAVDYFATVWLNGRQIGEHEGGYLPF
ncbi:MAG TPA: hypothetical protein VHK68_07495, partial [Gemmatimonadales bacterium]|nr:hypothetical protein [Gemmatimonadales bacterium]